MKDRTHDEATAELFQKDPAFALAYLDSVLEEGDQAELMIALRQLSKAYGGVARVAEAAHLNPTQLYRTLSPEGNPELRSLSAILKAMGMRLSVQPLPPSPTLFTMKLEPELRAEFMAEAEAVDRPASQILREMMREFIQRQRNAREYEAFLSAKVAKARESMAAGQGIDHTEVKARFAAKRAHISKQG